MEGTDLRTGTVAWGRTRGGGSEEELVLAEAVADEIRGGGEGVEGTLLMVGTDTGERSSGGRGREGEGEGLEGTARGQTLVRAISEKLQLGDFFV